MSLKPINTAPANIPLPADAPRRAGARALDAKNDETRLSAAATTLSGAASKAVGDTSRIESIRSRIADGTYRPNPRAIAEKMLQEAWLTRK